MRMLVLEDMTVSQDLDECIRGLPRVVNYRKDKAFKTSCKKLPFEYLEVYQFPIEQEALIKSVYNLFDQSQYHTTEFHSQNSNVELEAESANNYKVQVDSLVLNLSAIDCQIFLSYLFVNESPSLDSLASKFKLPKSSLHLKIASFKKKISTTYIPVNQDDGVLFLEKLHDALDKMANE
jgi:hypothetical protein